jgi:hypothetical protein
VISEIVEERHADATFKEIAGDNPMPLESLLAHRIVVNGLLVHTAEIQLSLHSGSPDAILEKVLCWKKRMDAATPSIRAPAQVRKLQLPTVNVSLPGSAQVNIGEK